MRAMCPNIIFKQKKKMQVGGKERQDAFYDVMIFYEPSSMGVSMSSRGGARVFSTTPPRQASRGGACILPERLHEVPLNHTTHPPRRTPGQQRACCSNERTYPRREHHAMHRHTAHIAGHAGSPWRIQAAGLCGRAPGTLAPPLCDKRVAHQGRLSALTLSLFSCVAALEKIGSPHHPSVQAWSPQDGSTDSNRGEGAVHLLRIACGIRLRQWLPFQRPRRGEREK